MESPQTWEINLVSWSEDIALTLQESRLRKVSFHKGKWSDEKIHFYLEIDIIQKGEGGQTQIQICVDKFKKEDVLKKCPRHKSGLDVYNAPYKTLN